MAYQFTQTGAEIQDILDQVGTNTGNIAQNTQDIGTLNTSLSNFTGLFNVAATVPTIYSSRATNVGGGYIQVSNMIFVSVSFELTGNISGKTQIFSDLPKPLGDRVLTGALLANNSVIFSYISASGSIYVQGSASTGNRIAVSGVYFGRA